MILVVMCDRKLISFSFIYLAVIVESISGFNVSPTPNYVFSAPKLNSSRSSYFGLAVTLRQDSVMVGAPRAQPSIPAQKNIEEIGAVYKCQFVSNNCSHFVIDRTGNVLEEPRKKDDRYKTQVKDHQWLGGTMDGFSASTNTFVVCAYKFKAVSKTEFTPHYLHGICYVTQSTNSSQPSKVTTLNPYSARNLKNEGKCQLNSHFAEFGFSVHVTQTQEIIIGAPGVCHNRGSVVRSKKSNRQDEGDDIKYIDDVVSASSDPIKNRVPYESYFGYAVSSGYFYGPKNSSYIYVASAPQANFNIGAVYLFSLNKTNTNKEIHRKIIHKTINGHSLGEYFGYALLAEDFDNDGFPDLAIAAPLHSKTQDFDNGAVYIWKNKGKLNFDLQTTLTTAFEKGGRFGSALAQIGDINLDHYNDLAVGAPFEEHGAVYIYLGSSSGLSQKHSQKITTVLPFAEEYAGFMFGHALSRGVDIDGNSFNDLAIGSPNSDTVYVYQTYPTVEIVAKVYPSKLEIFNNETIFNLTFTWNYKRIINFDREFDFGIYLKVDEKLKRALFDDNKSTKDLNMTIKNNEQSSTLQLKVTYLEKHLLKPINIEMHYDFLQKVPEKSKEFCKTCAIINPHDPKVVRTRIVFKTDCTGAKCVADLKLASKISGVKYQPYYIIGSAKTINIEYTMENIAQTAYFPELKIEIPTFVTVSRISKNCTLKEQILLCALGYSLVKDMKIKQTISFNLEKLEGDELLINATALTASDETNENDNNVIDRIPLHRYSEVDLIGKSLNQQIYLDTDLEIQSIIHQFVIKNNGPSYIDEIEVKIFLPQTYQVSTKDSPVNLFNFAMTNVMVTYKTETNIITWTQNEKEIFQSSNTDDLEEEVMVEAYDLKLPVRVKRDLNAMQLGDSPIAEAHLSSEIDNLPKSRMIIFNCSAEQPDHDCIEGKFNVRNFFVDSEQIDISIEYQINLSVIKTLFKTEQDIFIFQTSAAIQILDTNAKKRVIYKPAYTEFHHHLITPWWIYVISLVVGLIILLIISAIFNKMGFFKRENKEKMEMYKNSDLEKVTPLALKDFAFRDDYLNLELK